MKSLTLLFIICFCCSTDIFAQNIDDNTDAINRYFENIISNPVTNFTPQQNNENKSIVHLSQMGENNSIYINSLQSGDKQEINQEGTKNSFKYYTYYSIEKSNLTVNQEGTLNSLQIFGENSLMKNAVINQKSSFKDIVIKNYTKF